MKTIFLFTFCLSILFLNAQTESTKYRVIGTNGVSNIVFASEKIEMGQEDNVKLTNNFIYGDAIWARAYFPKKFGEYKARTDEKFYVDLYIDGQFVQRISRSHPESTWGQIQVWLYGTGEDDFSEFADKIENAGTGEHNVMISVGMERYQGLKDHVLPDGSIKKEKVFTLLTLCEGTITVVVQ